MVLSVATRYVEVKARENGDVLDVWGEKQGGVKDDPLRLVKLHG